MTLMLCVIAHIDGPKKMTSMKERKSFASINEMGLRYI